MKYTIKRATTPPRLDADWNAVPWRDAEVLEVANFSPKSSDHRPRTRAKLLYDDDGVSVKFVVDDRYVRAANIGFQAAVCNDSCVEWFAQPDVGPTKGAYLNFEMNCGGSILLFYIEDPSPSGIPGEHFKKYTKVPDELLKTIRVYHSLPAKVDPAIEKPTTWSVAYFVPWSLFETYFGKLGPMSGRTWRGNFFKCGDQTPKPHWATWAPIGEVLRFHQPQFFAPTHFE